MIVEIFISIAVAILIWYFQSSRNRRRLPPGSLGIPLIGDSLGLLRALKNNDLWGFYDRKRAKYGPIYKVSMLGSTVVVMPAPAGHKLLFSNEERLVLNSWPTGIKRLLGPHSVTGLAGEDYKRIKKVIMTFLKPEALQKYVPRVSQLTLEHLRNHWEVSTGGEFVIYSAVKRFIFSVACDLFMSLNTEAQQLELEELFVAWTKGIVQPPYNIPGTLFHEALKKRDAILLLLDKLISKRKQELQQGSVSEVSDMLSVMLSCRDEDGQLVCSEAEIKDNLLLMLFAGHDTSTSTLTIALKFLSENPFWKDQVLQENLAIGQQKKVEEYSLEWDDLKRMKVTWRVLQETLRLQPPAGSAYRDVIQDFEFGGYVIPKGWKVSWTLLPHRTADIFSDPHKFDPSRFEGNGPAPYTYVPFGGGPRSCPGNEFAKMVMLVQLHYLFLRFDWDVVNPSEQVVLDPMPRPLNGLCIKLRHRS